MGKKKIRREICNGNQHRKKEGLAYMPSNTERSNNVCSLVVIGNYDKHMWNVGSRNQIAIGFKYATA